MKALGLLVVFAAAGLLVGCSDAAPTGPVPASRNAGSAVLPEADYLSLTGPISIRNMDTEDRWYSIEGIVQYEWLHQPALGVPAAELRIRTEAKMVCISFPERTCNVLMSTSDPIEMQKAVDPIVKRYHVQSTYGSLDLVLVLRVKDGDLSIGDIWLERSADGGEIATER